jgi:hypothetical protein
MSGMGSVAVKSGVTVNVAVAVDVGVKVTVGVKVEVGDDSRVGVRVSDETARVKPASTVWAARVLRFSGAGVENPGRSQARAASNKTIPQN